VDLEDMAGRRQKLSRRMKASALLLAVSVLLAIAGFSSAANLKHSAFFSESHGLQDTFTRLKSFVTSKLHMKSDGSSSNATPERLAALKSLTPEARADWVPSLPGWGDVDDFDMFSGYALYEDNT
jgi:hypothetical protein